MSIGVIIAASGVGSRMGSSIKKQFISINGKTILDRTIQRFQLHSKIDEIIVVTNEEDIPFVEDIVNNGRHYKVKSIVKGGHTRLESVYKGLIHLTLDWVLVHDAARPFVEEGLVDSIIEGMYKYNAVIPGIKVSDTMKVVDKTMCVTTTLKRESLYSVQTPQAFRRDILLESYHKYMLQKDLTDDASLVEKLGISVKVIQGDYKNIKLTTPFDLEIARILIESESSL